MNNINHTELPQKRAITVKLDKNYISDLSSFMKERNESIDLVEPSKKQDLYFMTIVTSLSMEYIKNMFYVLGAVETAADSVCKHVCLECMNESC